MYKEKKYWCSRSKGTRKPTLILLVSMIYMSFGTQLVPINSSYDQCFNNMILKAQVKRSGNSNYSVEIHFNHNRHGRDFQKYKGSKLIGSGEWEIVENTYAIHIDLINDPIFGGETEKIEFDLNDDCDDDNIEFSGFIEEPDLSITDLKKLEGILTPKI